ncbi:MAG: serine/threonine protein kinase [Candidatus Melainabacteria bacterium]|nr:MAG: serine/threonine protein kinase [Candidatus Melainabacteria bacterium]
MSSASDGLRKIKAVLERDETVEQADLSLIGGKVCPACNRKYPKDSLSAVCTKDRTLLMIDREHLQVTTGVLNESRFARRYQIKRFVGEGDLTQVYLAHDMETWGEVLIKLIKPHMLGTPRRIRRFADALQETMSLQHPGIVKVLDSGIMAETKAAPPQVYVVVENLKTYKSLKTILHKTGPMAPYVVIETMLKACEILQYAFEQGWLHKDLKPSNIFISLEGEQVSVKISDFGVAERMFRSLEWETNATKTASIYGHAAYIAPEVAFGAGGGGSKTSADAGNSDEGAAGSGGSIGENTVASEIYSLGCIMYHVLKGMQPFEGNNDFDTLTQHMGKRPKPFADELKVPKELEAIIMKCLEKDSKGRYNGFGELAGALNTVT